jgi:hypothetical protein
MGAVLAGLAGMGPQLLDGCFRSRLHVRCLLDR